MRHFFSRRQTCLLMIAVLMSLSACGFKLRGPVSFPFHSIYIAIPDASPLGGELRRQIRANGATEVMTTAEGCLLYTSPSPRDGLLSRMPSSA